MENNRNTSGLLSLRQIVMSFKSRSKELNMLDYEMLMQLAIEGYTYLNIFHTSQYNVAYLQLDGRGVANLPSDFIEYTKVGINLCGRLYTLSLNENIIPPTGDECGIPIDKVAAGCCEKGIYPIPANGYGFVPHYRGDSLITTLYAAGGGWSQAGQYRFDIQNRQIIVTGVPKTEIVLEYRSSGVKTGEKTFVPKQAREAIIAWLRWHLAEYGHINANPERMKRNYMEEESLLKTLDLARTHSEYMDMFYRSWNQSVKR